MKQHPQGYKRLPDYDYQHSAALDMMIAIHRKNGHVYTEDKVRYSPEEITQLRRGGIEVDKSIHAVKKVFEGEIVEVKR